MECMNKKQGYEEDAVRFALVLFQRQKLCGISAIAGRVYVIVRQVCIPTRERGNEEI